MREARRLAEEAERQAATIVDDARTTADRIRADSERELVAATQRRDSINAQLANVRQMLVTLSGSAPAAFPDEVSTDEEPVQAEDTGEDDAAPADDADDAEAAADEAEDAHTAADAGTDAAPAEDADGSADAGTERTAQEQHSHG
jgi:hypothetical protein